jgi:type I restriction enzyme S subunit
VITGSAQPGLKSDFARHVELDLPTFRNQQRIADVLDGVSNATRRTELVVEKLSRMKEGLLQDLLTRAIAADGTLWDYERSPDQFEDSSGRLLPVGWLLTTLREVATRITDGDHHTPSRAEHGVLLLSARNVLNGHLDLSDVDYVPETEYRRMIKRCHPEPGDILISCSGTIGRVAEVPEGVRCVLVRSAALVKLDRAQINPRYAEWALQSHDVRRQILVGQRQAAQPNLFQSEISSLVIPLPPLDEQVQIAAVLDRLRDRLDSERRVAEKLRALKLGVAKDLLTGRVSVEDFDPRLARGIAAEAPG